jgi:uncharacterized phiE125 gp8 family phage protein
MSFIMPPFWAQSYRGLAAMSPHAVATLVTPAIALGASTVANPTVLTALVPHGLVTGDTVTIAGHVGSTPAVDGSRVVTVIDTLHFSVPVTVTIAGAGGTVTRTIPIEPMTLTQGKLRAGLDWVDGDPRDWLMLQFIAAARMKVEQDTGLSLLLKTYDVSFDWIPVDGGPFTLPWRPARVTAITYLDSAGAAHALTGADYWQDPSSEAPVAARAALNPTSAWPTDLRPFQPWVVRLIAGWPDVASIPPPLLHAVGLLTAHYATVGRDIATIGHEVAANPYGYDDAIAPYQLVSLA